MTHNFFLAATDIANAVIDSWHPHLASVPVAYLAVEEMKSKDRETWAKIRKATPVEQCLATVDLILVINEGVWEELTYDQRVALLDHEFCHVGWDAKKDQLVMRDHDLEEFGCIAKRHGPWRESIKLFGEQLELFDDTGALKQIKVTVTPGDSSTHHVQ